ncbi:MAG TPA: ATP-binding protein, partial [Pyrinomonadaceae bacterium]|nr:ATP-binding protein [Pyrinomonadaceae bacterium]
EIIKILRDTLPKSIAVKFFVPDNLWTISADPTQLHQVLMNLSVNARDAMPTGGTLTLKAENVSIDTDYAQMHPDASPGKFVLITVGDTGCGIAPENLDKIFEPFFTTKELDKGTGLGLSTVLGIIKNHQGFINFYSEPERGTRFDVYLPAIETFEQKITSDERKTELPRGRGELILIVDDEEAIRKITRWTLEKHGYRVLTAANGEEALNLYAENKDEIAVVLTDMMMPVMDGGSTVRALLEINPQQIIIAASGLLEIHATQTDKLKGVNLFLPKPFTAEKLLQSLARLLKNDTEFGA